MLAFAVVGLRRFSRVTAFARHRQQDAGRYAKSEKRADHGHYSVRAASPAVCRDQAHFVTVHCGLFRLIVASPTA